MPTLTPSVVVLDLAAVALARALAEISQLPAGLWQPLISYLKRHLTDVLIEAAEPAELPDIVIYLLTDILLDQSLLPVHRDALLDSFYNGFSCVISGNFDQTDEDE